jgi:hypothetical protein
MGSNPEGEWDLISDDDVWSQICDISKAIRCRWDPPPDAENPFNSLSYKERTFLFLDFLEMEISDGGFDQWFSNPTGDFVAETRVAARQMGLQWLAELIREAEVEFVSQHRAGLPNCERVESLSRYDEQYATWRPEIRRQMLRWWRLTDENGRI